jgi:hypothetical protein
LTLQRHQEETPEELANIQRRQLHLDGNASGWFMLHAAAATHNVKVAQQLLDLGAHPAAGDAQDGLTPLHLACMGRVKNEEDMRRLLRACQRLDKIQVIACSQHAQHAYASRAGCSIALALASSCLM